MKPSQHIKIDPVTDLPNRILLYLNVSTFRFLDTIASLFEGDKNDANTASLALLIIGFTEYFIINFFFPQFVDDHFFGLVINIAAFQGLLNWLFAREILAMANNYNAYYNKGLFYIFLIFIGVFFFGLIDTFNNAIGHLPPGK